MATVNVSHPPCVVTGLDPNKDLLIEVWAKAAGNNVSNVSRLTLPKDQIPPTPPRNLVAAKIGYFDATLRWDAATDNIRVAGYRVYSASGLIATVEETEYQVKNLRIDTSYTYKVRALDTSGNLSTEVQLTFRTEKDVSPPEKPTGLAAIPVSSQVAVLLWVTPWDDVRVTHNVIVRDGSDFATIERPNESSVDGYLALGLTPGTTYRFAVAAMDAAGNRSVVSNAVNLQTPILDPPESIEVINISRHGFELRWKRPENSIGITGYRTRIDNHAGSWREVHSPSQSVQFFVLQSANTYSVEICSHDISDRYSVAVTLEVTTLG
jgi:chitodextrinase